MLVLGRRENESIYIGENIVVKVIKIQRNLVQIGIEAPPEVVILHEEITPFDEKKLKNR